jgi:hypothetical protein
MIDTATGMKAGERYIVDSLERTSYPKNEVVVLREFSGQAPLKDRR